MKHSQQIIHLANILLTMGQPLNRISRITGIPAGAIVPLCDSATSTGIVYGRPVATNGPAYDEKLHHWLMGFLVNLPKYQITSTPEKLTLFFDHKVAGNAELAEQVEVLLQKFLDTCVYESYSIPVQKVVDGLGTRLTARSMSLFLAQEECKGFSGTRRGFYVTEPMASSREFWRGAFGRLADEYWIRFFSSVVPDRRTEFPPLVLRTDNGKKFLVSFLQWVHGELSRALNSYDGLESWVAGKAKQIRKRGISYEYVGKNVPAWEMPDPAELSIPGAGEVAGWLSDMWREEFFSR